MTGVGPVESEGDLTPFQKPVGRQIGDMYAKPDITSADVFNGPPIVDAEANIGWGQRLDP